MALQVLLVEDDPGVLKDFITDLPSIFERNRTEATLHPCGDFAEALTLASDPLRRYDLIISDTYRGPTKNGDADVLKMVQAYQGLKFCPLVVYSSGVKPADLIASPFLIWADKSKPRDIDHAITQVLKTGVPQIAKKLHEELESSASSFLWQFLEKNWDAISKAGKSDPELVERLIRRRAAIQMGDMVHDGKNLAPVLSRDGSEYYVYPKMSQSYYSLGDILRNKQNQNDFRVVLTPHCHLFVQPNQACPRADYVLTLKTLSAAQVLGDKIAKTKQLLQKEARHKRLGQWTRSPALM